MEWMEWNGMNTLFETLIRKLRLMMSAITLPCRRPDPALSITT